MSDTKREVVLTIGDGVEASFPLAKVEVLYICTCPWWSLIFNVHRKGCVYKRCYLIEEVK